MKSGGEQEFSSDKLSSACYLVFHWRWVYHQNIFNCSPSTGERLASAAASLGLGRTGGGGGQGGRGGRRGLACGQHQGGSNNLLHHEFVFSSASMDCTLSD